MYLVFTDETNKDDESTTFFLVGGVAIPADVAHEIHAQIEAIRTKYGYRPGDSLKYSRASKPPHVSNEAFNSAKSEVLDLCAKYSIKIFLYACHHLIAETRTPEVKFQWGCNGILLKVNQFLKGVNDHCLVLQDRHPVEGEFQYYRRRFMESQPSDTACKFKLDRVLGFGSTCDGASHLASIADIALGSYRFCINNPEKDIVNGVLMPRLLASTWGYPDPIGKGIGIFPAKQILKRECILDYQNLRAHLRKYLMA